MPDDTQPPDDYLAADGDKVDPGEGHDDQSVDAPKGSVA